MTREPQRGLFRIIRRSQRPRRIRRKRMRDSEEKAGSNRPK
jgi:hypothetical protein